MERLLKVQAILLTLGIVLLIYPALAWSWFQRPFFWILYLICVASDLWCINFLKKIQMGK